MSKRDVADLACRILALCLVVVNAQVIVLAPVGFGMGVWELIRYQEFAHVAFGLICVAVPVAMLLWFVWFLWSRSYWIATKLVPDDANYGKWPHIRVRDLQAAAFSVVGLVALFTAVQALSRSVGHYIDASRRPGSNVEFADWLGMEGTLAALVNAALGLWLMLGSRSIVKMIRRLRGVQTATQPNEQLDVQSQPATARGDP